MNKDEFKAAVLENSSRKRSAQRVMRETISVLLGSSVLLPIVTRAPIPSHLIKQPHGKIECKDCQDKLWQDKKYKDLSPKAHALAAGWKYYDGYRGLDSGWLCPTCRGDL